MNNLFADREKNKKEQRAVKDYQRNIDDILSREEDIIKTAKEKKRLIFAVTEAEFLLSDIDKLLERMEKDDIDSPGIRMQILLLEEARERILSFKSDLSSEDRSLSAAKALGSLSKDLESKNRFIEALNKKKGTEIEQQ